MTGPAYRVELEPRARKRLALLDPPVRRRVAAAIGGLAAEPRPAGAVALAGRSGVLRIRAGDYRILYEVRDDRLVVLVISVGHRREILPLTRRPWSAGQRQPGHTPGGARRRGSKAVRSCAACSCRRALPGRKSCGMATGSRIQAVVLSPRGAWPVVARRGGCPVDGAGRAG